MLLDDRVVLDGESAVEGSFGPAGRVLVATSDGGTEFVKQVSAGVKVLVFEAEALALSEVDAAIDPLPGCWLIEADGADVFQVSFRPSE